MKRMRTESLKPADAYPTCAEAQAGVSLSKRCMSKFKKKTHFLSDKVTCIKL